MNIKGMPNITMYIQKPRIPNACLYSKLGRKSEAQHLYIFEFIWRLQLYIIEYIWLYSNLYYCRNHVISNIERRTKSIAKFDIWAMYI